MFKLIGITVILLLALFAILSIIQIITKKPLRSGSCRSNAENMNSSCGCGGGSCENS